MPPKLTDPIPLEALRDLLGICRALFVSWTASGASPIELEDLLQIGKDLAEAYRLARNTQPNTLGHRAAWARADEATRRLGQLIGEHDRLQPVVAAATSRVVGGGRPRAPGISEREAKRVQRRIRN